MSANQDAARFIVVADQLFDLIRPYGPWDGTLYDIAARDRLTHELIDLGARIGRPVDQERITSVYFGSLGPYFAQKLHEWASYLRFLRVGAEVTAVEQERQTAEPQQQGAGCTPAPAALLTSWREITTALGLAHSDQDKVKSLNERYSGPIPKPQRGGQPIVAKDKLLEWWNRLALMQQEIVNQRQGETLSAEAQHNYGRTGTAAPEVGGGVKRRRGDSRR